MNDTEHFADKYTQVQVIMHITLNKTIHELMLTQI